MRTDVKLGIAISMALVLVVGGYFLFKTDDAAPISIAETPASTPSNAKPGTPPDSKTNPANRGLRTDGANRPSTPANTARNPQPRTTPGGDNSRTAQAPTNSPTTPTRPSDAATQPNPTTLALPQNSERSASNPPATNPAAADSTTKPSTPGDTRTADTSGAAQPTRTDLPVRMDSPTTLSATDPSSGANANPPSGSTSPAMEASKPAASREAAVEVHRSQPGDTLISLAQAYYGSAAYVPLLREHNPQISDPSRLTPGTAVKIPAVPPGWQAKAPTSTPTGSLASNQPNPSGRTAVPNSGNAPANTGKSGRTYTVRAGDSFYRIAEQQLGNPNRWKELLTMNTTVVKGDPTRLRPGQVLTLPES